jgi:hypothetical protein
MNEGIKRKRSLLSPVRMDDASSDFLDMSPVPLLSYSRSNSVSIQLRSDSISSIGSFRSQKGNLSRKNSSKILPLPWSLNSSRRNSMVSIGGGNSRKASGVDIKAGGSLSNEVSNTSIVEEEDEERSNEHRGNGSRNNDSSRPRSGSSIPIPIALEGQSMEALSIALLNSSDELERAGDQAEWDNDITKPMGAPLSSSGKEPASPFLSQVSNIKLCKLHYMII